MIIAVETRYPGSLHYFPFVFFFQIFLSNILFVQGKEKELLVKSKDLVLGYFANSKLLVTEFTQTCARKLAP